MKKIFLGLFMLPSMMFCMEGSEPDDSANQQIASYQLKEVDRKLWRAIDNSNYNEVLEALRNKANQNYVWPKNDETYKHYADLTAVMFSIKRLRAKNRSTCAWSLGSAVARDLGGIAMKYMRDQYTAQYPIIGYVEPFWGSHTAGFLFGSQYGSQPIVETYRPEKRISQVLLIKDDTDLTVARETRWQGHPVTIMTYLGEMLKSYNPVTRKDGSDLSYQLSVIQRKKIGLNLDDVDDSIVREGGPVQIMGFSNANNGMRTTRRGSRLYYLMDDYDF